MSQTRTWSRNIQDETGVSGSIRKEERVKKNDGLCQKDSEVKELSNGESWNNLTRIIK